MIYEVRWLTETRFLEEWKRPASWPFAYKKGLNFHSSHFHSSLYFISLRFSLKSFFSSLIFQMEDFNLDAIFMHQNLFMHWEAHASHSSLYALVSLLDFFFILLDITIFRIRNLCMLS